MSDKRPAAPAQHGLGSSTRNQIIGPLIIGLLVIGYMLLRG